MRWSKPIRKTISVWIPLYLTALGIPLVAQGVLLVSRANARWSHIVIGVLLSASALGALILAATMAYNTAQRMAWMARDNKRLSAMMASEHKLHLRVIRDLGEAHLQLYELQRMQRKD